MVGLIVLMWFSGMFVGWGLSYKINNKVLKHQVKYLKGRVKLLRTIWISLERQLPKGKL